MNRLEETRRILESTNFGRKQVRNEPDGDIEELLNVLPEPEPEREVRLARAVNKVYRNLPSDTDRALLDAIAKIRRKYEEEAKELVEQRIEVEAGSFGPGLDTNTAVDPISKVTYTISDISREMDEHATERAVHYVADEVVQA